MKKISAKIKLMAILLPSFLLLTGLIPVFHSVVLETQIPQSLPSPNVDLSGKMSFAYPIALPQGIINPALGLQYVQNGGSSELGTGWQLVGIESVYRDPSRPGILTPNASYISTLAGSLLKTSSGDYRSKNESFIKTEAIGTCAGGSPCSWLSRTRDGMKYYFAHQVQAVNRSGLISTWALTKVEDLNGNSYQIFYLTGTGAGEYLPEKITYQNKEIRFGYETYNGKVDSYALSALFQQTKRLKTITIHQNQVEKDRYTFLYEERNDKFYIKTIQRSGYNDLTFTYSPEAALSDFSARTRQDNTPLTYRVQKPVSAEIQGQCRIGEAACACTLDPICYGNPTTLALNQAACGIFMATLRDRCNLGDSVNIAKHFVTDLDGDGKPELAALTGYQHGETDQVNLDVFDYESSSFQKTTPLNGLRIQYNSLSWMADIDGDKKADFIYSHDGDLRIRFGLGNGFDDETEYSKIKTGVTAPNFHAAPDTPLAFNQVVDINGDGRADFIHGENGKFYIYLFNGQNFDDAIEINTIPQFTQLKFDITNPDESKKYADKQFADWDGDGYPDFIGIYNNERIVVTKLNLQNKTAALLGEYTTLEDGSTPLTFSEPGNRWFVDVNADGKLDFVSYAKNSVLTVYYYTGQGFVQASRQENVVAPFYTTEATEMRAKYHITAGQPIIRNAQDSADNGKRIDGTAYTPYTTNTPTTYNGSSASFMETKFLQDKKRVFFADANADGYPDFIRLEALTTVHLEEDIYAEPNLVEVEQEDGSIEIVPDGTFKLIRSGNYHYRSSSNSASRLLINYSDGKGFPQVDTDKEAGALLAAVDLNTDGVADIVGIDVPLKPDGNNPGYFEKNGTIEHFLRPRRTSIGGLLTKINGTFKEINIDYSLLEDYKQEVNASIIASGGVAPPTLSKAQPLYPRTISYFPTFVVKRHTVDYGDGYTQGYSYFYGNLYSYYESPTKAKSLGFDTMETLEDNTGGRIIQTVDVSNYETGGTVKKEVVKNKLNEVVSETDTIYGHTYIDVGASEPTLASGYPGRITTKSYFNGTLNTTQVTNIVYDSYLNQTEVRENINNGELTKKTTKVYNTDTTNWILGTLIDKKSYVNNQLVSHVAFSFTGMNMDSKTYFPDQTGNLRQTVSYSYDAQGRPTQILGPGQKKVELTYQANTASQVSSKTVYTSASSSLTQNFVYDDYTGKVLSATATNPGQITTYEYDRYGRLITITQPGDTEPTQTYEYRDTGNPSKQTVIKWVHGDEGSLWTLQRINPIGKIIRQETVGLDGLNSVQTTEYDKKTGDVIRKSNTYLGNDSSSHGNVYTSYTYDQNRGNLQRIDYPDGTYTTLTETATTSTSKTYSQDGTLLSQNTEVKNKLGQVLTKTTDGRTVSYKYYNNGKLQEVNDASGNTITFTYDLLGRKTQQTDKNTGITRFEYTQDGKLDKQTDARGKSISYEYDWSGRVTKIIPSDDTPTIFTYDETSIAHSKGKLTTVSDGSGTVKNFYNLKGQITETRRTIDEFTFIFQTNYDTLGRANRLTYPDGTKVNYHYNLSGHLDGVTMDSADGSSTGHPVVSYLGPILETGKNPKMLRVTGNNVKTEISFDPIKLKPTEIKTTLGNNADYLAQAHTYSYNTKGQITKIVDKRIASREQNYTYDTYGRLKQAKGIYGTIDYEYDSMGRLSRKGAYSFAYNNSNHVNAPSQASSANTGVSYYNYDAAGNMISREGDTLTFNALSKLRKIETYGGERLEYIYDSGGNRIKTMSHPDNKITYNLNGLYEVNRTPGKPDTHTVYVQGLQGEVVAQMTRTDASLLTAKAENGNNSKQQIAGIIGSFFLKNFNQKECSYRGQLCKQYVKNRFAWIYKTALYKTLFIKNGRIGDEFRLWTIALTGLFIYGVYLFGLKKWETLEIRKPAFSFVTPILLLSVIITFGNCKGIGNKPKTGNDPPWYLIPQGINDSTPSVNQGSDSDNSSATDTTDNSNSTDTDTSTTNNGNQAPTAPSGDGGTSNQTTPSNPSGSTTPIVVIPSNGGGTSTVPGEPVTGMYFLHPDHNRNITMVTDASGAIITGGALGGKSDVVYKPYGEIDRSHSSGPDIFRYKYTSQKEDSKSRLYYYKARYYDPKIGNFIQPDGFREAKVPGGSNPYLYVAGDPINNSDPSGNIANPLLLGAMIGYVMAPTIGVSRQEGAMIGLLAVGTGAAKAAGMLASSAAKAISGGARWAAEGVAGGALWAARGAASSARWASKGWDRLAKSFNRRLFGRHHNKNSYLDKVRRLEERTFRGALKGLSPSDISNYWTKGNTIQKVSDAIVFVAAIVVTVVATILLGPYVGGVLMKGFGTLIGVTIAKTSLLGMTFTALGSAATSRLAYLASREMGRALLGGARGASIGIRGHQTGKIVSSHLDADAVYGEGATAGNLSSMASRFGTELSNKFSMNYIASQVNPYAYYSESFSKIKTTFNGMLEKHGAESFSYGVAFGGELQSLYETVGRDVNILMKIK